MTKKYFKFLLITVVIIFFASSYFFYRNFSIKKIEIVDFVPEKNKDTKQEIEAKLSPITLSSIFSDLPANNVEKEDEIVFLSTGDIMQGREANFQSTKANNFNLPFLETAEFLGSADLTFGNLEAPYSTNCPVIRDGMQLCANPKNIEGLKFSGIDLVSIANNHIKDKGEEGYNTTKQVLSENSIKYVEGELVIQEVKGVKFGFLAYSGIYKPFDMVKIKNDIENAKKNCDFLIVMPHWGKEYTRTALAGGNVAPDDPKKIAREMIDAGTDLILGNHPHWYQGLEIYKEKPIVYSHGNFVFDQDWSKETTEGFVTKLTFQKNKLADIKLYPIKIYNNYQPRLLEGNEKQVILEEIKKYSIE